MGIFSKIFSGKKVEKVVELELDSVEQFLQKSTEQEGKDLEKRAASKVAEVKHLLAELQKGIKQLRSAQISSPNRKLEKIVETAKSNAERQLGSLVEKLQPPQGTDPAALRDYSSSASALLQREIRSFGKNIAYTSISLKQEIKQLGAIIRQLDSTFSEMQSLFSGSHSFFLQKKVKQQAEALRERKKALLSLESEIQELEKGVAASGKRAADVRLALEELRRSKDFSQIASLNEKKAALLHEKQDAKSEVLSLFSKVEKPLHRLEKAASANKFILDRELELFLSEAMSNPFTALRKDPKAEKLKQLLHEAENAIGQGIIEFKDREREKRLSALREATSFNFFERVFWKFNKIDADLASIEKELQSLPALKREGELAREAKLAAKDSLEKREALSSKKAGLAAAQQQIPHLAAELQAVLQEATGRPVLLKP